MSDTNFPANPEGLQIIAPLKPLPEPRAVDGAVAICGACGIRIYPVMGYSCLRIDCPVFVKAMCLGSAP